MVFVFLLSQNEKNSTKVWMHLIENVEIFFFEPFKKEKEKKKMVIKEEGEEKLLFSPKGMGCN